MTEKQRGELAEMLDEAKLNHLINTTKWKQEDECRTNYSSICPGMVIKLDEIYYEVERTELRRATPPETRYVGIDVLTTTGQTFFIDACSYAIRNEKLTAKIQVHGYARDLSPGRIWFYGKNKLRVLEVTTQRYMENTLLVKAEVINQPTCVVNYVTISPDACIELSPK